MELASGGLSLITSLLLVSPWLVPMVVFSLTFVVSEWDVLAALTGVLLAGDCWLFLLRVLAGNLDGVFFLVVDRELRPWDGTMFPLSLLELLTLGRTEACS